MDHAVILAGGAGTRLWPMSRRHRPKQLLPLVDGQSLLSLALQRVGTVFDPQRTWVVTSEDLADAVRQAAPRLPADNVIGEPALRDTANAIGLACALLRRRDGDARVGIFTADHVIRPVERFAAAVTDALALLEDWPEALVTLGVVPASPHTGLGYVRRGDRIGPRAFRVRQFVEKPDLATAQRYLDGGDYYWNSGMFIWRAATVLDRLARFRPDHAAGIAAAADAWARGDRAEVARLYGELPRISIDYALMEPAAADPECTVLVRELDCEWLDLGSWAVLGELVAHGPEANACQGRVVSLDSAGNVLISDEPDHLLAVLGVRDTVVVHSGGATLVVPKDRAQDVRRLLDEIRARFPDQYE